MRTCTRCNESKPLELFSKKAASKDGYHTYCKPCASEYHKEWYARNQERIQQKSRDWAREHPEENRAKAKKWREENPERFKANLLTSKAKRKERLDAAREVKRINKKKAWENQNGICPCGLPIDRSLKGPDPMAGSIDHIIPLSKGGKHNDENIQWMHIRCNNLKAVSVVS